MSDEELRLIWLAAVVLCATSPRLRPFGWGLLFGRIAVGIIYAIARH